MRDEVPNNVEQNGVAIDFDGDGLKAYMFFVTLANIQGDGIRRLGGWPQFDWDGDWEVQTKKYDGDYVLTIYSNIIPGDTSSQLLCSNLDIYGNPKDTITIEETFEIQAIFNIDGQCNEYDSADVVTEIFGGTPPYSTFWSNGDITPNTSNLQPNPLLPYSLSITDNNGCQVTEYLSILPISSMKTFSSNVGVICKDDKSAEVRVFVSDGNPPFTFEWSNDDYLRKYIDSSSFET